MTVDEALAVLEQERLDAMTEGMSAQECEQVAAYIVASCVHKDRKHILELHERAIKAEDERDAFRKSLEAAIAFICNTEAFGRQAETGILQSGDARFDIDEARKLLAA